MSDIVKMRDAQREVYKALHTLADELDEHHMNLNKAKLSFSVTGSAAGIMTLVGLALTPLVVGVPFVIAGGIMSGLSAAGNIGSFFVERELKKKIAEKAKDKLLELASVCESTQKQLYRLIPKLNGEEIEDVQKRVRDHKDIDEKIKHKIFKWIKALAKETAPTISSAIKLVRSVSDVVETIVELSVGLSRALPVMAGFVVGGVGLGFDLPAVIYYSIKVHKREPCAVAQNIRNVANCLKGAI